MSQTILFSGHMIDRPGRLKPRFTEQRISIVTREISKQLTEIDRSKLTLGLAGGACGGDIIFHELCLSLGIATEIYLPKSINEFKHESVAYAGNSWIERFAAEYPHFAFFEIYAPVQAQKGQPFFHPVGQGDQRYIVKVWIKVVGFVCFKIFVRHGLGMSYLT